MKKLIIGSVLLGSLFSFGVSASPVVVKADKDNHDMMARCYLIADIAEFSKPYRIAFFDKFFDYATENNHEDAKGDFSYQTGYASGVITAISTKENVKRKVIAKRLYRSFCKDLTL